MRDVVPNLCVKKICKKKKKKQLLRACKFVKNLSSSDMFHFKTLIL